MCLVCFSVIWRNIYLRSFSPLLSKCPELASVRTSFCSGSAGFTLVLPKDVFLLCSQTFVVTRTVTFVLCLCLLRFTSVPADPNRWDMLLFAGGPVWAIEWCPTPDGAAATQYVALACHQRMDDQHYVNKMYGGPGLVQLWDVGKLEHNTRCDWKVTWGLIEPL